jgi:hypothetical protein
MNNTGVVALLGASGETQNLHSVPGPISGVRIPTRKMASNPVGSRESRCS